MSPSMRLGLSANGGVLESAGFSLLRRPLLYEPSEVKSEKPPSNYEQQRPFKS